MEIHKTFSFREIFPVICIILSPSCNIKIQHFFIMFNFQLVGIINAFFICWKSLPSQYFWSIQLSRKPTIPAESTIVSNTAMMICIISILHDQVQKSCSCKLSRSNLATCLACIGGSRETAFNEILLQRFEIIVQ